MFVGSFFKRKKNRNCMFILSLDCVLFFFPPSYVDVVVGGGGGSYRHDWCDIAYFCVRVLFLFVFFCLVSHANRLHHCRNVQVTEEVQELLVFRLIVFFSFFLFFFAVSLPSRYILVRVLCGLQFCHRRRRWRWRRRWRRRREKQKKNDGQRRASKVETERGCYFLWSRKRKREKRERERENKGRNTRKEEIKNGNKLNEKKNNTNERI